MTAEPAPTAATHFAVVGAATDIGGGGRVHARCSQHLAARMAEEKADGRSILISSASHDERISFPVAPLRFPLSPPSCVMGRYRPYPSRCKVATGRDVRVSTAVLYRDPWRCAVHGRARHHLRRVGKEAEGRCSALPPIAAAEPSTPLLSAEHPRRANVAYDAQHYTQTCLSHPTQIR